ncbi:DnaD domain-containing protein [Salirhabdus salicampi]|uniref:DnaD domain-containing protein n=1 Tax=Salirhabdus salicampi TaxID=476102 RepID=UPI0020C44B8E|nr:DnaD domain-containing protein [Salirhabdus salicampi]MCP8616667.1 DnaD domain-containing protein [Salirhabdus salicampi]
MNNNAFFYQTLLLDQMTIPKKLILSYKQLRLNEIDFMVLLHIYRLQVEGIKLPSVQTLGELMTKSEQEIAQTLRSLMKKGLISIEQHEEENVIHEWYSLDPLWKKLYEESDKSSTDLSQKDENIFILFEQEFGRALSPIEIETVNQWIDQDQFSNDMIKAALREAVLMGKLSFRYIDRILSEWKKKGIKTVDQARAASQSFRSGAKQQQVKDTEKKRDTSIYYNWLEGEE